MTRELQTPQARLLAGVARTDITPPVGIYHRMWGAALHDQATGVHKPLLASVLWLAPRDSAKGSGQILCLLDHCVIDGAEMKRFREAMAQATEVDFEQVAITLSHTHGSAWMSRARASYPGGDKIPPYLDELTRTLAKLAAEAKRNARPASLVVGVGRCSLARQRDYWDPVSRTWVCGFNPEGSSDDTLLVGRIDADDGTLLATLVNYACHPTTLAWENTLISPDYVGALRETVERETQVPCLFLQGSSGDLGPRVGYVGDTKVADRNGRQVAWSVLATLEEMPPAGTTFAFRGPVVSGAVLGPWDYKPLPRESLTHLERWRQTSWDVSLPYRADLPTLDETRQMRANWQAEEDRAGAAGDADRQRDCHAKVEQMTRQITRLEAMPGGKAYPYHARVWQTGTIRWVLVPGELYQDFQRNLRASSKDPVFVITLTDDWQPGYIPPAGIYGKGIYQESIAMVGFGTLEYLTAQVQEKLAELADASS